MHSKNFLSLVLCLSLTASVAIPRSVFAEDGEPDTATAAAKKLDGIYKLEEQEKTYKSLLEEIKNRKDFSQEKKDADTARITQQLWDVQSKLSYERRKLKAGTRKAEKVYKKDAAIEELKSGMAAKIERMKELQKQGLDSAENKREYDNLQSEVYEANESVKVLKESADRKARKYIKKVGGPMPRGNAPSPAVEPVPPAPAEPTIAQLKKLDACYDLTNPTQKEIYSFFPLGESDFKTRASETETKVDTPIGEYFRVQVQEVSDLLHGDSYGKISALKTSSFTSKVAFVKTKNMTQEKLAEQRSLSTDNNLGRELFLDGISIGDVKTEGYERTILPAPPGGVSVGPNWTPGDYQRLSKQTPTDAEIAAAAIAILDKGNHAPTPVRVTSKATYAENLAATTEALTQCCSTNKAALKYQPYQFSKVIVSLPKFTPKSEACIADAKKIATTTSVKDVGESKEVCTTGDCGAQGTSTTGPKTSGSGQ